jgi:hypothetical protein
MVDWHALFQMIGAAGIAAAIVTFALKKIVERTIAYTVDRKLKEIEAQLRETTELRIAFGKDRIEEYQQLSSLVLSAGKDAIRLCEKTSLSSSEISELSARAKDLEKKVYDIAIILRSDGLYEKLHTYKNRLIALTMNLDNELRWLAKGQRVRAEGIRETINFSIVEIQAESQSIIDIVTRLIVPAITTHD